MKRLLLLSRNSSRQNAGIVPCICAPQMFCARSYYQNLGSSLQTFPIKYIRTRRSKSYEFCYCWMRPCRGGVISSFFKHGHQVVAVDSNKEAMYDPPPSLNSPSEYR